LYRLSPQKHPPQGVERTGRAWEKEEEAAREKKAVCASLDLHHWLHEGRWRRRQPKKRRPRRRRTRHRPYCKGNPTGAAHNASCACGRLMTCCIRLFLFNILIRSTPAYSRKKVLKQQRSTLSRTPHRVLLKERTPHRVTLYLYGKLLLRHIRQERSFQEGADQY
jgi:hypothetical protein